MIALIDDHRQVHGVEPIESTWCGAIPPSYRPGPGMI